MSTSKTIFAFTVLLCAVVLLIAAPAQALEEEHQDDGSDCMGPTDPFCPLDPGAGSGGGSGSTGCYTCAYIPVSPTGDPAYYACIQEPNPTCCSTSYLKNCRWGTYTCYWDGYCVFA